MLALALMCNSLCEPLPKIWRALVYMNWIDGHSAHAWTMVSMLRTAG